MFFIDQGAKHDVRTNVNQTPLMIAAVSGQYRIVANLIAKEADVNAQDEDGDTALRLASQVLGYSKVAILLVNHMADIRAQGFCEQTALVSSSLTLLLCSLTMELTLMLKLRMVTLV